MVILFNHTKKMMQMWKNLGYEKFRPNHWKSSKILIFTNFSTGIVLKWSDLNFLHEKKILEVKTSPGTWLFSIVLMGKLWSSRCRYLDILLLIFRLKNDQKVRRSKGNDLTIFSPTDCSTLVKFDHLSENDQTYPKAVSTINDPKIKVNWVMPYSQN